MMNFPSKPRIWGRAFMIIFYSEPSQSSIDYIMCSYHPSISLRYTLCRWVTIRSVLALNKRISVVF